MILRSHFLTLFAVLSLASTAFAAPGDSPSMSAGATESKNPMGGLGGLGKERPKDAKTEITAKKEATFDNTTSKAEFTGSVVVKDPQFTLYCDNLKVSLKKGSRGLQQAIATGNVVIVQDNKDETGKVVKSICRSGQAVFEPDSGDIVLTVWPSVQQGVNLQVSTEESTKMTLNRDGRSKTEGASKTVIVESGERKDPLQ